MKKPEMLNLIYEMLAKALDGTGFRLKKSEQAFVRQFPGGRQMLGLPLWDYNPEFEFSLNICIRLDAVEQIFHLFSLAEPKYHAVSDTTITRLEYFTGAPGTFKVITAADVASAGSTLSKTLKEKIMPFFSANEEPKALDRAANRQQPGIDVTQPPSGLMHRLILARLAGNPEFEQLVQRYLWEMRSFAEADKERFQNLVQHLRSGLEKGSAVGA